MNILAHLFSPGHHHKTLYINNCGQVQPAIHEIEDYGATTIPSVTMLLPEHCKFLNYVANIIYLFLVYEYICKLFLAYKLQNYYKEDAYLFYARSENKFDSFITTVHVIVYSV